jgi:hypothetical protein
MAGGNTENLGKMSLYLLNELASLGLLCCKGAKVIKFYFFAASKWANCARVLNPGKPFKLSHNVQLGFNVADMKTYSSKLIFETKK